MSKIYILERHWRYNSQQRHLVDSWILVLADETSTKLDIHPKANRSTDLASLDFPSLRRNHKASLYFPNRFHYSFCITLSEANQHDFCHCPHEIFVSSEKLKWRIHEPLDDTYWVPFVFTLPVSFKVFLVISVPYDALTFLMTHCNRRDHRDAIKS